MHPCEEAHESIVNGSEEKEVAETPQPTPPFTGTLRSMVPWMERTATPDEGVQGETFRVPSTGAMAAMREESSQARRWDMSAPLLIPVAKMRALSTQSAPSRRSNSNEMKSTSSTPEDMAEPQHVPALNDLENPSGYTVMKACWSATAFIL